MKTFNVVAKIKTNGDACADNCAFLIETKYVENNRRLLKIYSCVLGSLAPVGFTESKDVNILAKGTDVILMRTSYCTEATKTIYTPQYPLHFHDCGRCPEECKGRGGIVSGCFRPLEQLEQDGQ